MAAVRISLARAAIVDAPTAVLAILAAVLLLLLRINSAWLVLGGGGAGIASAYLLGQAAP
jgi:chromate transporter